MNKIKKDDNVMVIAGKDKGRTGKVLKVITKMKNRKLAKWVIVENLNIAKKHVKPNPQREQAGGIISREMPLPISNVGLVNPTTNKVGKVGFKFLEDGQKVRYFKESGEVIDV